MKILVAEDNKVNALQMEKILTSGGHSVKTVSDGQEALTAFMQERYDALITDWMMPNMDGMDLIRRVRAQVKPCPIIMVATILDSHEAKLHALQVVGADEFFTKPYDASLILARLKTSYNKYHQPAPKLLPEKPQAIAPVESKLPFYAIGIASSTGGPPVLAELLSGLKGISPETVVFIAQHGPIWMMETLVDFLQQKTTLQVRLAEDNTKIEPGVVYIAPGERHMEVLGKSQLIILNDSPPENYVKPAADPLFRSIAKAFGKQSIAVVLTGLGKDGTLGAQAIHQAGGQVFAQEPKTCAAPFMPQSVINANITDAVLTVPQLSQRLTQTVKQK